LSEINGLEYCIITYFDYKHLIFTNYKGKGSREKPWGSALREHLSLEEVLLEVGRDLQLAKVSLNSMRMRRINSNMLKHVGSKDIALAFPLDGPTVEEEVEGEFSSNLAAANK